MHDAITRTHRARSVARAPRVIPVSPRAPREISPGARGVSSPAPRARPPRARVPTESRRVRVQRGLIPGRRLIPRRVERTARAVASQPRDASLPSLRLSRPRRRRLRRRASDSHHPTPARAERVVDSVTERIVTPTQRARVAERRKRRDLRAKPRHLPFALARRARSRRVSTRVIDARRGMKPRRRARSRTFVVRVNPPPTWRVETRGAVVPPTRVLRDPLIFPVSPSRTSRNPARALPSRKFREVCVA